MPADGMGGDIEWNTHRCSEGNLVPLTLKKKDHGQKNRCREGNIV